MSIEDAFRKRLAIKIDSAGLSCTLTILPGRPQETPSELEIASVLTEHGLAPSQTDNTAVVSLRERALAEPESEHTAVIAAGTPAIDGTHGTFTLAPELAEAFAVLDRRRELLLANPEPVDAPGTFRAETDDDGAIDFREQSAFVIVRKGDTLGTVTAPCAGTDGVSVKGDVIPAKGGHSFTIQRDDTTRIRDGRLIAATCGRLVHDLNRIGIERDLELSGDVDYTTGNIDFPGSVVVHGGVKDHFRVVAGMDLRVDRLVEAAHLAVRRDAYLGRGMAGRGEGTLSVGRDLHAHYLDGISGEIGRDCEVVNEIKECTLEVAGAVRSPACAMYGGSLTAVRTVELGVVGSAAGATTSVQIGTLDRLDDLIQRLGSVVDAIHAERERAVAEFGLLSDSIRKLTPTQAERLTELQFNQIRTGEFAEKVREAANHLLDTTRSMPTPRLTVTKVLHRGVRIRLGHHEFEARDDIKGPAIFELDQAGKARCMIDGSNESIPIGSVLARTSTEKPNPLVRLTEHTNSLERSVADLASEDPAGGPESGEAA